MLRTSLRSARLLGGKPSAAVAGRQWQVSAARASNSLSQRFYADQKKPGEDASKQPVFPASETRSSERKPLATDDVGESKPVETGDVPLTPPTADGAKLARPQPTATIDDVGESSVNAQPVKPASSSHPHPTTTIDDVGESSVNASQPKPATPSRPEPTATIDDVGESTVFQSRVATTPPPPSPPPKKSLLRRIRNLFFTLVVLPALLFGGGVWYARVNDNFHDFFTEYIPFGEQAVLYLEELEFKKKFPNALSHASKSRETGDRVRIPAQSGASWRVADSGEPTGRHTSSTQAPARDATKNASPSKKQPDEAKKASSPPPPETEAPAASKSVEKVTPQSSNTSATADSGSFKAPEVNEPSKFPPLQPIDLMALPHAKEPVVRDLVHMLNDLILVINADGAHGKYSSSVAKAKGEVLRVGSKLSAMKDAVEKKAAKEVRTRIDDFDKAATELVERVEKAMISQEMQWRQEFESEMVKVRGNYDERVKVLMDREKQLNEEKLQNQLLEQAVALKKEFVHDVEKHVEQERKSRLGKLDDLSKAVSELEKLTVGWNDVVDSNLRTQQMHVAVDAVRASLEDSQNPRPFIRELVALKEIANDDAVVDAAIASMNPSAYQRGISTSSQLIDRFRKVANEVRKASLLPEEAGVASHASSWVLSHVMFKKQGLAQGGDVESVLTRTQTYLEEGDLDAAAREMNGLDGWAKTLSKDWLGEVRKVLEVQQAVDVIATEARLQSLRVD